MNQEVTEEKPPARCVELADEDLLKGAIALEKGNPELIIDVKCAEN